MYKKKKKKKRSWIRTMNDLVVSNTCKGWATRFSMFFGFTSETGEGLWAPDAVQNT